MTISDLGATGQKLKIEYGTSSEKTVIGEYKISYSSRQENSPRMKLIGYDATKEFDVDVSAWYNSLTWPQTVKSMRDSLCAYIGIEQIAVTLINDNIQLLETIKPSNVTGIAFLSYLGQINAVFPHGTSDYKLQWISLGTTTKIVQKSYLKSPTSYAAKDYNVAPIGKLTIKAEVGVS